MGIPLLALSDVVEPLVVDRCISGAASTINNVMQPIIGMNFVVAWSALNSVLTRNIVGQFPCVEIVVTKLANHQISTVGTVDVVGSVFSVDFVVAST